MTKLLAPRNLTVYIFVLLLLISFYLLYGIRQNTQIISNLIRKIDNFERKIDNLKDYQLNDEILRKTANKQMQSKPDQKLDNLKETIKENLNNDFYVKDEHPGDNSGSHPNGESEYKNYQTFHDKNLERGVPESLLKEMEKSNLTIEQLETHCHIKLVFATIHSTIRYARKTNK